VVKCLNIDWKNWALSKIQVFSWQLILKSSFFFMATYSKRAFSIRFVVGRRVGGSLVCNMLGINSNLVFGLQVVRLGVGPSGLLRGVVLGFHVLRNVQSI
jgi:hypothetical protein